MSCKILLKLENNSFKVGATTQVHNGARVESRAHVGKRAGRGAGGRGLGNNGSHENWHRLAPHDNLGIPEKTKTKEQVLLRTWERGIPATGLPATSLFREQPEPLLAPVHHPQTERVSLWQRSCKRINFNNWNKLQPIKIMVSAV